MTTDPNRWSALRGLAPNIAESAPTPDAAVSIPLLGRGGSSAPAASASQSQADVLYGKSVCILLSSNAYQSLCCSTVGKTGRVVCLAAASECQIELHKRQRAAGDSIALEEGIYVQVPGGPNRYFIDTVGPIDLLPRHRDAILECEEKNISLWPTMFNDWSRTFDSAELAMLRTAKSFAKTLQTPAKRNPNFSLGPSFVVPPSADSRAMKSNLEQVEAVIVEASQSCLADYPDDFKLSECIHTAYMAAFTVGETQEQLSHEIDMNRSRQENAVDTTNARVTELELGLGDAPDDWAFGATVWSSLEGVAASQSSLANQSDVTSLITTAQDHDQEFNRMFQASADFKVDVEGALRGINLKLATLSSSIPASGPSQPAPSTVQDIADLKAAVADLQAREVCQTAKIKELEDKLLANSVAYTLAPGRVLRDASDVSAWLVGMGASAVDFGGFCDVYSVLIRIQKGIDGSGSIGDYMKKKKDAKGINMSEDKSMVAFSFQNTAPPLLGGDKTDKSDVEKAQSYKDWRNKQLYSGLAYDIENALNRVRLEIMAVINLNYSPFPELLALATLVLNTATGFLTTFITWVDSTYDTLVYGGNTAADVWQLTAKVMRALFDEGIGPKRVTPTGSSFSTPLEQASVIMWGVIRTHMATTQMTMGDLRDQPIVTGNYAKWLINHSGKKDASECRKELEKVSKTLTDFKSNYATTRALAAVEKVAETAKKTADKALNKQA